MGAIYRQNLTAFLQTLVFAAFIMLAPMPAHAQNADAGDVTSNLALHLKLDETSGTSVTDSSTNTNNGTLGGGMNATTDTADGKITTSLDFDGSDDVITIASDPSLNDSGEFTYAGWFYPTTLSFNRRFFENGVTVMSVDSSNNLYLNMGRWSGGYATWNSDPNTLTLNQWHHIAVTYNYSSTANDPIVYINGTAVTLTETVTPSGTVSTTDHALYVGNRSDGTHPWAGRIDDFRFYDRALSADDIALLYRSYPGQVTCNAAYEAVMWFNHDEGVMQYCNGSQWINMGEGKTCGSASCGGDPSERVVFAHNTGGTSSNFGGVAGADSLCQTAATAAGLQGTYLAWIAGSDPNSAPAVRFEQSAVPYVRVDGTIIANDWADLTDGTLDNNINLNAQGAPPNLVNTRTNVNPDGTQMGATADDHCNDWSATGGFTGNTGLSYETDSRWTDASNSLACTAGTNRPYCFEQGPPVAPTGCTSPTGKAGETNYNLADGVMQYCNGSNWINMGPKITDAGGTGFTYTTPTTNLDRHYALDETSGTTAVDSVGGNDGTMQNFNAGTASVPGVVGTAIDFNGSDNYIDTANYDPGTDYTFSAWINPSTTSGTYGRDIVTVHNGGAAGTSYLMWFDTTNFNFTIYSAGSNVYSSNATPASGTWQHVTWTRDSSGILRFYLNGVFDSEHTGTPTYEPTLSIPFRIGTTTPGGSSKFNGEMDEVRGYSRALSAEEVYALYRSTGGTNTGLVGHWTLDETTGTTASDSSGNGNDGTLNGTDFDTDSVAGISNTAMNFDGTDDYVQITDDAVLSFGDATTSQPLSVCAWVNANDMTNFAILSKCQDSGTGDCEFSFGTHDGDELRFNIADDGITDRIGLLSSTALTADEGVWTHYCGTYDGTATNAGINLYRNGTALGTSSNDLGSFTATHDTASTIDIGSLMRLSGSFNEWADGQIDDPRIYNRALSAAEVADLYASTGGSSTPITGCPNIGDVCDDGSVYAGLSPDGNVPMYTTPADAGLITWNDGSANFVDTAMVNCSGGRTETACDTGEDNTTLLAALTGSGTPAPYNAANTCSNLSAHGHNDWYLPAVNELNVLYTNNAAIGGFDTSGIFTNSYYVSSSEIDATLAYWQRFSDGYFAAAHQKNVAFNTRCVRKGGGAVGGTCSSPNGVAGEMIYNDNHTIMQYCNGSEWVGIGDAN